MDLRQNIGNVERVFRGGLGIILMLIGLLISQGIYQEILSNLLLVIGLILLIEGALGWCAGYTLLDMESIERKRK